MNNKVPKIKLGGRLIGIGGIVIGIFGIWLINRYGQKIIPEGFRPSCGNWIYWLIGLGLFLFLIILLTNWSIGLAQKAISEFKKEWAKSMYRGAIILAIIRVGFTAIFVLLTISLLGIFGLICILKTFV